jgi:hypothetical protein
VNPSVVNPRARPCGCGSGSPRFACRPGPGSGRGFPNACGGPTRHRPPRCLVGGHLSLLPTRPTCRFEQQGEGKARPTEGRHGESPAAAQHTLTTRPRAPPPPPRADHESRARGTSEREPHIFSPPVPAAERRQRRDPPIRSLPRARTRTRTRVLVGWLGALVWRPVGWGWRVGRVVALSSSLSLRPRSLGGGTRKSNPPPPTPQT